MEPEPGLDRLDPVLLSQVRLGIVTALMPRGEATFPELKEVLGVTQGNLGMHLRKLEEAGYVEVRKEFVDRKPRTTAVLTGHGREAFLRQLRYLEGFVE